MINSNLTQLRQALDHKKISSVELTQLFLQQTHAQNGRNNAFITITEEEALLAAKNADQQIAQNHIQAMTGIPFAHKDIFCTEGVLTSCASKMLANFTSPYDAHIVTLLKQMGAIMLGKTNMDEFAMGSSSETSYFGPVHNPWQLDHIPGGSSGGSAAAVCARMVPVATGSDTGGSIRQPASMTGICGIKPTYGLASRYGMIAFASSLDQAGVFGGNAQDCAILLSAITGFDPRDSTSLDHAKIDYNQKLEALTPSDKPFNTLRVGVPQEFFDEGISESVRLSIEQAISTYRQLGAQIVNIQLPHLKLAIPAFYVIAPAEASSNLARFDGVRYGYRSDQYSDLQEMYERSRAEGFGAEVKRRILVGTYVLSAGYYDAYYRQAQKLRRLISNDFKNAFQQCDLILGPTSPTTAWKIGEKTQDPVTMYLMDIYTTAVNLAGLPAMTIPCGFCEQNLPIGLQLIGNYFDETRLLGCAHQYQQHTDWHLRRPKDIGLVS